MAALGGLELGVQVMFDLVDRCWQALNNGRVAALAGVPRTNNPELGAAERAAWFRGWSKERK